MTLEESCIRLGPATVYLGEKSGKYPDGNQVVVRGTDAVAAFDTPIVANRLGEELLDADLVILGHVHEDHMAGLHRLPRAEVHVHEADVEAARSWEGLSRHYGYSQPVLDDLLAKIRKQFHYAPRPDAKPYRDGASWSLGGGVTVRAFHMPGHTAGHSVLFVEPGDVAFIGDIDLSSFGPYYGDATSSLEDFRRTLDRVKDIPAKAWVTSHHKGVITDRGTFLRLLQAFGSRLEAREEEILAFLKARPSTLAELVRHRFLYPRNVQDVWFDEAERRTTGQHLASLQRSGRAFEDAGRWRAL